MARRTYTREFKLQAVRMMTDQGLSVAEVARLLGVGENCLRNWRQAAREQGEAAFPGQGNPSPVAWACDALEVSESGYYSWAGREPSQAEQRRQRLIAAIRQVDAELRG